MNELYEGVFGHPKYSHWVPYNDVAALLEPAYGIVPLTAMSSGDATVGPRCDTTKLTSSLRYLSKCQGRGLPYTPVRTMEEKILFTRLIQEALRNGSSMTSSSTFEHMELLWKQYAMGTNNIYGKYAEHLALYYKKWQKSQARRDAVKATRAAALTVALEYTHPTGICVGAVESPAPMDQRTNDENASLGNESASADAASNVGTADVDDDDDDYVDTVMNESLPADLQQQESTVDVEAATVETNTLTIRPMTAIQPMTMVPQMPLQLIHGATRRMTAMEPYAGSFDRQPTLYVPLGNHPGVCGLSFALQPHPPPRVHASNLPLPTNKTARKRKRCYMVGCKNPDDCRGGYDRTKCSSIENVEERSSSTRKRSTTRTCKVPNCLSPHDYPGNSDRSKCFGLCR